MHENRTPLVVAIATHDRRAVIQSLLTIQKVADQWARAVLFVVGDGSTIPASRNRVVSTLAERFPRDTTLWVLWLDSDILVPAGDAPRLRAALAWAETTGVAVVGDYRMATGQHVLMAARPDCPFHHYSDEELAALPRPYPRVDLAGFGLTYVPQPLGYEFYADTVGEDIHFWWDHPTLAVHWIDGLTLVHRKAVLLS